MILELIIAIVAQSAFHQIMLTANILALILTRWVVRELCDHFRSPSHCCNFSVLMLTPPAQLIQNARIHLDLSSVFVTRDYTM